MKKIYLLHIVRKGENIEGDVNVTKPYGNIGAARAAYDTAIYTLFSEDGRLFGVDRNNPSEEKCEIEENDTLLKFHCHDNCFFNEWDIWVEEVDVLNDNSTFNDDIAFLLM